MITQKDLAKLAGVSQKTVNWALKGHPDVNEETRQLVLGLAEEHGYLPNQAACAIQSGRSGNIGMLISETRFASYMPMEMIIALKRVLAPHELNLLISCLNDNEFADNATISMILRKLVCDGILINYHSDNPEQLRMLLGKYKIPYVWVNERLADNCVYHDELQAGVDAADCLVALGHQRIAYINYNGIDHHSRTDRRDGYLEGMKKAGLASHIYEADKSLEPEERYTRIREMMTEADRPTAVIAFLDDLNIVVSVAKELGLSIPQDLSIVTFGLVQRNYLDIEMTTVVQDENELCQKSVEMLLDRLTQPEKAMAAQAISSRLLVGASTADL